MKLELSMWGRRGSRGSFSNPTPPEPKAFSNADYNRICGTIDGLAHTQLGHMWDPFTADELRSLFCPEVYRQSLTQTYSIESDTSASGTVFVNLLRVLPKDLPIFDDPKAYCRPEQIVLRVQWHRSNLPDGFVTPNPIFGTHLSPVDGLRGSPSLQDPTRLKFLSMVETMTRVAGEWATVKWVFEKLQNKLKTPQQMRYVWPAVYTLASEAQLQIAEDLANPSSRAGNNAPVPGEVMPYLKASYEVVARSVLLGQHGDPAAKSRGGQMRLVTNIFTIRDLQGNHQTITGV